LVFHERERGDLLDRVLDLVTFLADFVKVVGEILCLLSSLVDLEVLVGEVFAISIEICYILLLSLNVRFGFTKQAFISGNIALDLSDFSQVVLKLSLLGINRHHHLTLPTSSKLLLELISMGRQLDDLLLSLNHLNP
jgi:hypothetical protein